MSRFKERNPHLMDVLGRFEAHSHQTHMHDAFGVIGRLKDDGRRFWPEGSSQLSRWEEGCTELMSFLNGLGTRRNLDKQDLTTALREFFQEYEHITERMYQMMYGAVNNPNDDERFAEIFDWFNFVFRSTTYALVSGWIDDKQEDIDVNISVNLESGETSQEWTVNEMKIPAKYQRATKRI